MALQPVIQSSLRRMVFLVLLACHTLLPFGLAQETLTLPQAIRIALNNNPGLQAHRAKGELSEADVVTARTLPNPGLVTDSGIAAVTYRVGLSLFIPTGGRRGKRIALAQAQRDAVFREILHDVQTLQNEVRRDYTKLYFALYEQAMLSDLIRKLEETLEIAEDKEEDTGREEIDVIQLEMQLMNIRNDLEVQNSEVINARNALNTVLNQPLSTTLTVAPPPLLAILTEVSPEQEQPFYSRKLASLPRLTTLALENRPELLENQAKQSVASKELALARSKRFPDIFLATGPELVTGTGGGMRAFIIAQVELPIFDLQQGPIRSAEISQSKLNREKQQIENQIRLEVHNAYNAVLAQQARVRRYEQSLIPKSRYILEENRYYFRRGKLPVIDILNAQQTYITTRIGHQQAMRELQEAINDLAAAIGFAW